MRALAMRLRLHPMTIEIRTPTEDERDQLAACMAVSLNFGPAWTEHRAPSVPLDQFRCAFDGDRLLSAAGARPFAQWFGGRELRMTGVFGVATLPEHRGTGLASRAITHLLHEARGDGVTLSALYPATLRPYRRLGYELAGSFVTHAVRLDDLPSVSSPLAAEPYATADLDDVRACYRRVASSHDGPVDSDDPMWWPDRIVGHWNPDETHRVVVVRSEAGLVEGYLSYVHQPATGELDVSFDLAAKQFVWSTAAALHSLLGYARGHRGVGQALTFTGPPAAPLSLMVEEQRVTIDRTLRWMLRLLDVPGALEARGYADVSGSATVGVEDELFADNRGPWRIEASDGEVRVTRVEGVDAPVVSIGTLSSLYSGFVSARDAVRLGLLSGPEEGVEFLTRLFSGRPPFMYDFF